MPAAAPKKASTATKPGGTAAIKAKPGGAAAIKAKSAAAAPPGKAAASSPTEQNSVSVSTGLDSAEDSEYSLSVVDDSKVNAKGRISTGSEPNAARDSARISYQGESADLESKKKNVNDKRLSLEDRLKKKYKVKEVVVKESKVDTGIKRHSMLGQFAPGELEMQLLQHVQEGDTTWVASLLQKTGKEVIWSPWGGGMAKTCILYAAQKGDMDMCKILVRVAGPQLLNVCDLKQRDTKTYAKKWGWDIKKLSADVTVDCWNTNIAARRDSLQIKDASGKVVKEIVGMRVNTVSGKEEGGQVRSVSGTSTANDSVGTAK